MLEAASADLVSPSAGSAAPQIFSYPQERRPITPSFGTKRTSTVVAVVAPEVLSAFLIQIKFSIGLHSHCWLAK
jgi:hypothetical protein